MKLVLLLMILAGLGLALALAVRGGRHAPAAVERASAGMASPFTELEPERAPARRAEVDASAMAVPYEAPADEWGAGPTHSEILSDGEVVCGRVVDALTGRPRAGIVLELSQYDGPAWAVVTTAADGRFRSPPCFRPPTALLHGPIELWQVRHGSDRFVEAWIEPWRLFEVCGQAEHLLSYDERTLPLRLCPEPAEEASEDRTFITVFASSGAPILWERFGPSGMEDELFVGAPLDTPFFALAWHWTGQGDPRSSIDRPHPWPPWKQPAAASWAPASTILRIGALGDEVQRVAMVSPAELLVRTLIAGEHVSTHFTLRLRYASTPWTWRTVEPASSADPWYFHVPPGEWVIEVAERQHEALVLATEQLILQPGERRELSLELGGSLRPRRAVAGTFIWTSDGLVGQRPFLVRIGDGPWFEVHSDRNGAFEVWSARAADSVRLIADLDVTRERVEPAELDLPFGASDLRLSVAPYANKELYELRLFDATTGAPVTAEARGEIYGPWQLERVGRAERISGFDDDGESRTTLPQRAGLRWRVLAPGYRAATGRIPPPTPNEPYTAVRVPLERGFLLDLLVLEAGALRPLEGVRALDEGGHELGRSGADGIVHLSAPRWPARLKIEVAGHRPALWPDAARHHPFRVELEPE